LSFAIISGIAYRLSLNGPLGTNLDMKNVTARIIQRTGIN